MRVALRVLGIVALVIVLAVGGAVAYAFHAVHASFPQVEGTVQVTGIDRPVTVVRDDLGIPQIYASSLDDLFFTQGYVHAQDRFWEMDVRRHITAGRLSEMFGKDQVTTDSFLRTLGWHRLAEQEVALLSDRSRRILDAYSAGVNAYLGDRSGAQLSLEYAVLGLQNSSYAPEPWTPADSLAWLKALAWDLMGNAGDEFDRSVLSASVGIDESEKLFPAYPYDTHRPIVIGGVIVDGTFVQDVKSGAKAGAAAIDPAAQAAVASLEVITRLLDPWLGKSGPDVGSNSWVVSGEHTTTGKPLLANDPHLAPAMPSLWYQAGLHCTDRVADCDYDVAGWTMSGVPGVFIGHNDQIAWGFTNLGPDVADLVLEKVDGDTYLFDGKHVPLTTRSEVIEVAGGSPVTITVRSTNAGPLLTDVTGDDWQGYAPVGRDAPVPAPGSTATKEAPPDRGEGYAVALKWTALQPDTTFEAFDLLATARDWSQFRDAARLLVAPAQNLVFADVDGNIAYQAPGVIPIRRGYDGKWPVPGWTSRYAWTGTIPFEALPSVVNPPEGWIVTANQAAIGPDYPYFITDDWSYGSRSQRIVDLITERIADGGKLDVAGMQAIQNDTYNELGEFLAPKLAALPAAAATGPALALLNGWQFDQPVDSAAAAVFNAIWGQMVARMFDAAADTDLVVASGNDKYWQVVQNIWDSPDDFWWDDKTVGGDQSRDQTLQNSIAAAVSELNARLGTDPAKWRWGALHTLELTNQTLGTSGIGPIEAIFNRGPLETSGGLGTVVATAWTPHNGYEVDWVPSMRQVVDLSDFDASTWVNLTGASGHAFSPHYDDQAEAWRTGEQFPWPFSEDAVAAATVDTLTLTPH